MCFHLIERKYLPINDFELTMPNLYHGTYLFETFRWDLAKYVIFETFDNFWNFGNLKLFKPITGVAYLKLSDETWDVLFETFESFETLQLKLFKLETLWQPELFETFEVSFKDKKVSI